MNRRRLMLAAAAILHATRPGPSEPPPPEPETLRVSLPAISILGGIDAAREGLGFTADGCFVAFTIAAQGYYLYPEHNGRGSDPGLVVPELAGFIGIPFTLASGNHDREAVTTAAASAATTGLDGVASVVADTEYLDIVAVGLDAEAAFTGGAIAATGVRGVRGWRHPAAPSGAAATTQRAMRIGNARFPRRGRIVGWGTILTAHTAGNQVHVGLSRGSGTTPLNSIEVADLGTTTGTGTGVQIVWLAPEDVYAYDLDNDGDGVNLFLNYKTDANVSVGFVSSQDESTGGITYGLHGDFVDANGNPASATTAAGIWILGNTPPSGSGTAFRATWDAIGSSVNFYSAIFLIVQSDVDADGPGSNVVGYYGDWQWETPVGITAPTLDAGVWTGSAQSEARVGWSYTWPAVEDAELASFGVGFRTRANADPEDRFGFELGEGGTSDTNWTNATTIFAGVTPAGTGTNVWVDTAIPADEHYPLPNAGGRLIALIHRAATGTSTVGFVNANGETNAMVRTPHRRYNLAASEYEDPTPLSCTTPMAEPWTPVGTPQNPGNTGTLRWSARVRRTTVVEAIAA